MGSISLIPEINPVDLQNKTDVQRTAIQEAFSVELKVQTFHLHHHSHWKL
jgi:hypothetical protein